MTNNELAEVEEEIFIPLPQNEIPQIDWNGIPAYLVTDEILFRHIETYESIYFALLKEELEVKISDKKTAKTNVLRLYKIVNNSTTRAMLPMEIDPPFVAGTASARINLPPIPWDLIQKMDDFFRAIDKMYGTESIVLLTWDPAAKEWGVLVPDQTNTPAACDYDPQSVAGEKPAHVEIVGSAHSHPGMAAFASGTDHKDQATFDGIHITYGWLAKNNNQTEYHVELQVQGSTFIVNPDHIFEKKTHETSPDIEEWAARVTKKTYGGGTVTHGTGYPTQGTKTVGSGWDTSRSGSLPYSSRAKLPSDAPADKDAAVWIGILKHDDEAQCPFCSSIVTTRDIEARRCLACHQYIGLPGETNEDIFKVRSERTLYSKDINPESSNKKVYGWVRTEDNKNVYVVFHDGASGGSVTHPSDGVTAGSWFVPEGK
jgi:hypothetical protein